MADNENAPRITCGSVVLAGVLAVVVVVAMRGKLVGAQPIPWSSVGAAAVAVVSVFLIGRSVQSFLWGLLAAAFLTLHPSWRQPSDGPALEVLSQSVVLAVVAASGICFRLAFHPRFAWRVWPFAVAAMALGVGLAWQGDPRAGVVALVWSGLGPLLAAVLAFYFRQRSPAQMPSQLNLAVAFVAGLFTPVAGLAIYQFLDGSEGSLTAPVTNAVQNRLAFSTGGISLSQLNTWAWPHALVVVPIIGWALYVTLRRGWQQWSMGKAPSGWFLSVLSLFMLVGLLIRSTVPAENGGLVPIAVTVLLVVFLLGDWLRAVVSRLVLLPPQEREGAARGEPGT